MLPAQHAILGATFRNARSEEDRGYKPMHKNPDPTTYERKVPLRASYHWSALAASGGVVCLLGAGAGFLPVPQQPGQGPGKGKGLSAGAECGSCEDCLSQNRRVVFGRVPKGAKARSLLRTMDPYPCPMHP